MYNETFFDAYPEFLETSKTSAHATRLNKRYVAIVEKNRKFIEGKVVLDLASHDGRWSFAALKGGARKVIGVEARQHLVDNANKTFEQHGLEKDSYEFVCADLFEVFERDLSEVDTIFCLGIFYHITRHTELMTKIRQTKASTVIMDTNVCLATAPIIELRQEDTRIEGFGTTDSDTVGTVKLTGLPSEPAVNLFLNHNGFVPQKIDWTEIISDQDQYVDQYRNGTRITVRATRQV
jgi:hypothetical protein